MSTDVVQPVVLYHSRLVKAQVEPDGRIRIRREGRGVICNIAVERVVDVGTVDDTLAGQRWVALAGCVARVDFARHGGDGAGLVGPFPSDEAAGLAAGMRDALALPRRARRVAFAALADEPERYHERLIECDGVWKRGENVSDFAGAWLEPPPDAEHTAGGIAREGETLVSVVGFWRCAGERNFDGARTGHGPFGFAPAELDGYRIARRT
jgi:hypothetical protein